MGENPGEAPQVRTTGCGPCAPNRHAAEWFAGVAGEAASAGLRILLRPARWTGIPAARSRLKITFARGGIQSTRAPLACYRATAQTARPAAKAPSATWSGMRVGDCAREPGPPRRAS